MWSVLYLPFGAMSGFVSVALVFLSSQNGLSVTEGSFLNGANLVSQWLKWTWAPVIDVTLTPKRWYVLGTTASALGVFLMSAVPMSHSTLGWLLAVIAIASLLNSIVGMSIEAMMAQTTVPEEQGRTSGWFQAGNLGGAGLGGGLGLQMLEGLPSPWMAGAVLGALFMLCNLMLFAVPELQIHRLAGGPAAAFRGVLDDLRALGRTKGGLLAAVLCFLPLGTGAAQGTLTQGAVAAYWHAGSTEVAWVQGYTAAVVTAIGCGAGGLLCSRIHPRTAYAGIGLTLAGIAVGMAVGPATVTAYVVWNLVYAFGVGIAYAAFTAVVLNAIGAKSAATKYTLYASLSNFPIWWLGLLLGRVADLQGAPAMLITEAVLGVLAVVVLFAATKLVSRTRLPDVAEDAAPAA
ncbi:MAG: MFS transporter [Myxococcota bacterium]